jgi:hypothetical protein
MKYPLIFKSLNLITFKGSSNNAYEKCYSLSGTRGKIYFLAFFLIIKLNVFAQNPCEIPGYTFLGNIQDHSYYISDANTTWTEARTLAMSIGGHLATITSAGEQAFITANVMTNAWIGLTDEITEGTFLWVTGEPFIYSNWLPGEPNDFGGDEDYAHFWINDVPFWNDWPGWFEILYLVEFDYGDLRLQ